MACPSRQLRLLSDAPDGHSPQSSDPWDTMKRELPLVLLAVTSAGCDLLPQNSTEWAVALSVAGVLVVGAIVAAWIGARRNKR